MQETKSKIISTQRNNQRKQAETALPVIPDKRYFTIGEVGYLCGVKPHVLRYWEQEFAEIQPLKRRGNRRYYQLKDILLIRQIRKLLYEQGFTIEGARIQLASDSKGVRESVRADAEVKKMIADLEIVLQKLKTEGVS